ncbi:MAG: hypothetical protein WBG13_19965 [Pseudolabrys sp.]
MGYYFVVTPRTLAQRLIHCVGEDGNDDHGQHAPEHKLALFSYRGVDAVMGLPTFAQNWPPPPSSPRDPIFEKLRPDEIIKQAQERFKKAQNKEQVENVKMWCKDMIAELTFNEAGRLLLEAKTLLDAHKTVEATSRIERLQALDEATKRLASEVCKPD